MALQARTVEPRGAKAPAINQLNFASFPAIREPDSVKKLPRQ